MGDKISKRDNFSLKVRRTLAARAGHRCSVCSKPTSGPGDTVDVAISDGIAAHITAAAPNGPRFDQSLSSEERSNPDNGIWVCTKHGRKIDAQKSTFSVEVLRGLKRIREESASRELSSCEDAGDGTGRLIEFPYVTTIYKLFEVIEPQTYTYSTTAGLRDVLRNAGESTRILDLAPDVIVGTWDLHPNVAGILSTLLSNNVNYWRPKPEVLKKLKQHCEVVIKRGEWTQVALIEPLAFALAAQGIPEVHLKVLERLIVDPQWRDADAARIRGYYGNLGLEIAAILRHWRDPFNTGLLRANDTGRIIDLLLSSDKTLNTPSARQKLLTLLAKHATVLLDSGAPDLARSVNDFVEAFRCIKDIRDDR